jgi:hypothetical protein
MSASGHKQTFRTAIAMSALPLKADMCSARAHVRYGPIADMALAAVEAFGGRAADTGRRG